MGTVINQRQLRNDNAEVMRRVERGESFVVTRNGRPVADLVPHATDVRPPRFVPISNLARSYAALGPIDVASWYRDRDQQLAGVDDRFADPWTRRAEPTG